jgi:hypothetical protein
MLMKRVLFVGYSQSGQLLDVLEAIATPLRACADVEVVFERLQPSSAFPFPWTFLSFLDAFPETVHLDPAPNAPLSESAFGAFDLVVLGWQPWFLAPSQPVAAFLLSAEGKRILAGRPVISVVACRNMWLNAFAMVKRLIEGAGGRLLDHVALTDRAGFATFLTTPMWLLTGRRQALSWLPPAGVDRAQIANCGRFGQALVPALRTGQERASAPLLRGLRAVEVDGRLIAGERIGTRSFRIWGRLVRAFGGPGSRWRRPVLLVYVVFLIAAIVFVLPLTMVIRAALQPLRRAHTQALVRACEEPSGSADSVAIPAAEPGLPARG